MLKLGDQSIYAAYLGGVKIKRAYLGEAVVFDVSEPPVPTYTITASIDPAGSGTVSGPGTYQAGDTVTITAAPGDGYQFTGWQENGVTVSADAAYTFTVTGDRTLTAVFEEVKVSRLPEGYTELEYLEVPNVNNANYIPYLSIPATTEAYSFKVKFLKNTSTAINSIWAVVGRSTGSGTTAVTYMLGALTETWTTSNTIDSTGGKGTRIAVRQGTYNASNGKYGFEVLQDYTEYVCHLYPALKKLEVNGISHTYVAGSSTSWLTSALRLFNVSITSLSTYQTSPGLRVYYAIFYNQNGEELRNLVPCRNPSGVLGMYDTVKKTFYSDANTSSNAAGFIAGPEV